MSEQQQHQIIRRYADREHTFIRYYSKHGKDISNVVDALCRIARESTLKLLSKKDGRPEPMIKTHLDLSMSAVRQLPDELQEILREMQRKGAIFQLDTSRSRATQEATMRYQIRRILLAQKIAPLGRKDPIKLDTMHRLQFLLQDPDRFAEEEISRQTQLPMK